jgi:hypothetical protein
MAIEEITNMTFLDKIKSCIKKYKCMIMAVNHNTCDKDDIKDNYDKINDAFVYSIGRKEFGHPDILILCGSDKENPISSDQLSKRFNYALQALIVLMEEWDDNPVKPGHTFGGKDTIIIKFISREYEDYDDFIECCKEDIAIQAGNYYGTYDYELIVGVFVQDIE